MFEFFVPGVPAPQGSKSGYLNKKTGRINMVESSKAVKPWRKAVADHARKHFEEPVEGPVSVIVRFYMPRTKAMKPGDNLTMVQRPDVDKLLRAVLDGLTGVAFKDDSQVVHVTSVKRRADVGEPSGADIQVWQEVEYESTFGDVPAGVREVIEHG